MKLYQHQQKIIDLNPKKYGIFHRPGTGKTITALALAKKNNITVLVIVPKPVIRKWRDEMDRMGVEGEVIGREQFRIKAQFLPHFDGVIVDESHAVFGNHKSMGYKKLQSYLRFYKIEYLWLLTGTPYTSSPWSIFAAANLLGHQLNYINFRDRFFYQRNLGFRVVWEPKPNVQSEIKDLVAKIGDTVSLEDCFDVPEQVFEIERFDLTSKQKKAIKQLKKDELDPVVRVTKEHQIASGTLLGNEFSESAEYPAEKNDQIVQYAEENKKLVVFSRYNNHLELLGNMFKKNNIPYCIINGDVKDKETCFADAEASDRMVLLINSMISVGYEIPSFSFMVFASLSFSYVDYSQACHRILRANALKRNVYKICITKGTVDEAVYKSVVKKEDFSAKIYAKETDNKISERTDDGDQWEEN